MSSISPPAGHGLLCLTMNPSVDLATETAEVVPTHKLRCSPTAHDAGGGGINVARTVVRMGGRCTALCPAGGPTGDWLRRRLAEEGITSHIVPTAEDTRVSFTVHENRSGQEFRFVMPGPLLGEAEWRACLDAVSALDPFPGLVVASGSLPPGVPEDFYARLARLVRTRGSRLVLDTSGGALDAALREGVFLIKPNLRELCGHLGHELPDRASQLAAMHRLLAEGRCEAVALSLGHRGALLATGEGAWFVPPLPVRTLSAVGAGDSFVGGMVWSLARDESWPEALSWGVACGTGALLSVTTGLCRAADALSLREQIRLEPQPWEPPDLPHSGHK
ncbi:MAG: 1-phosphofructokinase family hexose kinase [Burkholderiales bacterium]|nr:MAG: 1-phosphofructokinase family hexose kinase [Burkholderiales bacterium]